MPESPRMDSGSAMTLVATAWSLFWTTIALATLGGVLYLEITRNISFDRVAGVYLSTMEVQKTMLILFGSSMIATGLAIMPLYQKDESAAGMAPVDGAN